MTNGSESLNAQALGVSVPGRTLVAGLDLTLEPGTLTVVLGKNGTGKTLTLHTLAGLRPPADGSILLGDTDLAAVPRRALARRLALLPQDAEDVFPTTVFETALMGRHPHVGRFSLESQADRDAAFAALARVGLEALADRELDTLSGGERRRLGIAQTLTQAPEFYLLDEPTNHLDPQHQLETLNLYRELVDQGACVVATMHDVNLAARFADNCLLLYGDGRWACGPTRSVLSADSLSDLFDVRMETVAWQGQALFVPAAPIVTD